MAGVRDPEATKARIFEAATAEFAAYGIAGARVDRIAREAKANKQLIYAYFGNKAELFSQVLEARLTQLAAEVPVDAEEVDTWIDRLMDYHAAHPELIRLIYWEGLEYGTDSFPHEDERKQHYDRKVAVFAEAQRKGVISSEIPPADLLFMLIALVSWSTVQPQMRRVLTGDTDEDRARLRASVRAAARRIVS
ncbi:MULTISPECIES: TetR/AcrR family transcriptional regulator [Streptomyces]|uniref:TetR/AcrR family transcriptional regulator n=1 Tax=Streptomyces TaxID=1883 RepID=UPI00163CFCA3|nr:MULTISPECIES: TetR family transcriptional regulator [Streptomyces]MBC2875903.1 TetR/AcrR family transcriptional regulator [Streptomyces sp. TYQ1024]UBI37746.1 TetR family transcriptional regulator [Streptomyces mobaraensis]UKW30333.1 TetR family transcriptional regulator [Streptomyces sp. TYQ1024]